MILGPTNDEGRKGCHMALLGIAMLGTELTLEGFGIEQFIEELELVPAADYPLRHSVD